MQLLPFFDLMARPGSRLGRILPFLLFGVAAILYIGVSEHRAKENPDDRVVPTLSKLRDGFVRAAFQPNNKGDYILWDDTFASAKRLAISSLFLLLAVWLGLHMGLFSYWEAIFLKFMLFFDKVPALAILPILFIAFGLGETSKIALIVIGVFPTLTLDTYLRAKGVAQEQIMKGLTLGATHAEVAYSIVLPQILPAVLDSLRLNLKAMVLFLIAGEAIQAEAGLGFRIFLVRRYLAMDTIIPYVIWISLLAFAADALLRLCVRRFFPWREQGVD
jgi:NitT/TauT family transport system permease protein